MRVVKKMLRVGPVVSHQACQGGSVTVPVTVPESCGLALIDLKVAADIIHHGVVDARKDVRACVVQRVIEIEKPGAWRTRLRSDSAQWFLIIVPKP